MFYRCRQSSRDSWVLQPIASSLYGQRFFALSFDTTDVTLRDLKRINVTVVKIFQNLKIREKCGIMQAIQRGKRDRTEMDMWRERKI